MGWRFQVSKSRKKKSSVSREAAMDGMDPKILILLVAIGAGYLVGKPIVHGVKVAAHKTSHAVVHVVTLGKK
jgi:hypothetical protein